MTTRSTRPGATTTRLVAATSLVAVVVACSEPPLPDGPVEGADGDTAPIAEQQDDADRDALLERLEELRAAAETASDHLDDAATATTISQARTAADRALGVLLEDAGTSSGGSSLLPATALEREDTSSRTDLLSATLAMARDVGGSAGTAVVDLLRDEVAGDLGAWERDAAGVIAGVERTASRGGDLDRLTEAILDLPGEATRALAWTLVAADADDPDTVSAAADRAAAHLGLVLFAIDEVRDDLDGGGGER